MTTLTEKRIADLVASEIQNKSIYRNIKDLEHPIFVMKNAKCEDEEKNLFIAEFFDIEAKIWLKPEHFFCPTALRTRLENLELGLDDAIYCSYQGISKSNKGRDMHKYFVKKLE